MSTAELIEQVIQLPPAERFILVDTVLSSLDKPDERTNEIWLDEAERRLKAYREGRLGVVPMDEVLKRLK